ncbi:hypothetical protein SARC_11622 [Sphaeroforma arctica JP610]|uniref:Inositol polyphosphate-related phosphatase domain-containing protein n=1 Tax=Sphaeroforma arctica JP610 TaxID=667725 RepID=A0A0L0FHA7_9EUKA|nr:hypothetical protein SARC_11622 [Sphaeroforma arctica JP610]KNC75861.1 hypothetical protein SARC_11622 [Sphaeroforma arctica JP610]|eukprot:XP_014149763.1 hypothetical protein SARC_11622 [Sphaeroforma arctica JP610]
MCGYQKGGMSHLWLREYDAKPTEPDDDENDMDAFETYEDSWSASGVGMAASGLTPDAMIEHDWINQTLRGRIDEYTVTKPIKVVCGTWNVCEKLPQDDLTDWLNTYENKDADIYAIGLQV